MHHCIVDTLPEITSFWLISVAGDYVSNNGFSDNCGNNNFDYNGNAG